MSGAGELFIVGFEGATLPSELAERVAAGRLGGLIVFARNLVGLDELCALTRAAADATPKGAPPLIFSIDQEGGRVQRVKQPLTVWPAMARLGATGDQALAERVGTAMGRELAALGINVNYAPVLDVHSNEANPIIGDRAFGREPERAAQMALAYLRGLESSGVRGCGKHYPGHGDTATDSHLTLPRVDAPEARLRALELAPFAKAVHAGIGMLMTAHVVYPAIDARPATMSRRWIEEILRGELGYDGVVVSDDLDMKAVAANWPVEEVVIESLLAGVDCFLACRDPEIQARAERALDEGARKSDEVRARIEQSRARLRRYRATLRRPGAAAGAWRELPLEAYAEIAALR
jgi:beta-N-acetylhexosaminidase